ncbi:unnamed protein product [Echinostoma caproni]|uniref:Endo/exonuclease/phosphatase domain-containing protein n=1 Tax=Echinostoma caproni TaxID=27848 RepID=A0A183AI86_9TREM|nr:unnamed protein product [Echinostoma caproni]
MLDTSKLVARYELDRKRDRFHGHRTSQLIELLEFIRITASSSDAVVITGDFNLESNTPDIAFFKSYLGVSDAWKDSIVRYSNGPLSTEISHERLEVEGCTCDRADNPYRNDEWTKYYGNGERLDYIFYRAGNGPLDSESAPKNIQLTCRSRWLDMRQVPNDADKLHYSDHVGVGAQLTISRVSPTTVAQHNRKLSLESTKQMETVLLELADHINSGLQQCRRERILHLIFAAGIAFLLFYILTYGPHRHWFLVFLSFLLVIVLSPCCFLLLWGSLIGRITERRALTNSGIIINLILAQIKACMKQSEGDTHANGDYTILSY